MWPVFMYESKPDLSKPSISTILACLLYIREYRPTMWAFLLGPAGGNSLPFLLLKATHKNKLTCYLKYFIRMRI